MVNNKLRDRWNQLTEVAERFGGWTPYFVQEGITKYFDGEITGKNLDLCCGYYPHVKGSVGVDISPLALRGIEIIGERTGRKYLSTQECNLNELQNGLQLPFQDSEFDSATMIAGWNYIKPIEKLVEEVDRVVAPKGLFHVVQFLGDMAWDEDAFRKDNPAKIMEQFRRLSYSPRLERICYGTDVVVVETK